MFEQDLYYSALNFPVRVRLDPLLMSMSELLGLGSTLYGILQALVLFVSTIVLLQIVRIEKKATIAAGVFVLLAVYLVVGPLPWAANVHWYPLLLGFYLKASSSKSIKNVGAYSAALLVWVWTAGALSVFGLLILIPAALFFPSLEESGERAAPSQLIIVLTLLAAVFAALTLPVFLMPEYPGEARLAEISPLLLYEAPLIGPFLSPNPLRYDVYRQAISGSGLRAAIVMVLMLVLGGLSSRDERKNLRIVLLAFLFCLALQLGELPLSGSMGMYAPFPTLSRLIPGLALVGLPWLLFPLFLILVLALWLTSVSANGVLFSLALLAGTALFTSVFNVYPPYLAQAIEASEQNTAAPSRYVLERKGDWASEPRRFDDLRRLKRGEDFTASATASPLPEEAVLALDGDPSTRWRTARPQQIGDYFRLDFEAAVPLIRLILSVQNVSSDFPRGIRFEAETEDGTSIVLIEEEDWIGPVKWSGAGQPYFGPQSEVVLDLPKVETVRSLKITQIGKESLFDWSIVEVKLYAPPRL